MQWILEQDKTRNVICTLREKRNNLDSGQLFKLIDPANDWTKTFVQNNNLSAYKERYDEFEVTLTGTSSEDRTKGIIHVPKSIGDLRYKVYEQTSGSTNLDVSATTENLLEQGYVKIKNSGYTGLTQQTNYNVPNNDKKYYV